MFKVASGLSAKEESVQTSTLLHVAGERALEVYNSYKFATEEDKLKLSVVLDKLEGFCTPQKNITYQRYLFFSRHQNVNEGIDAYATELKNRSATCEFGTLKQSLIRDMIVIGLRDNKMRERLLDDAELTMDKAIKKCRAKELTTQQAQELSKAKKSPNVDAVNRGGARRKVRAQNKPKKKTVVAED